MLRLHTAICIRDSGCDRERACASARTPRENASDINQREAHLKTQRPCSLFSRRTRSSIGASSVSTSKPTNLELRWLAARTPCPSAADQRAPFAIRPPSVWNAIAKIAIRSAPIRTPERHRHKRSQDGDEHWWMVRASARALASQ